MHSSWSTLTLIDGYLASCIMTSLGWNHLPSLTLATTSIISILAREASMVATHTSACSRCMLDNSATFWWGSLNWEELTLSGSCLMGDWNTRARTEHSICVEIKRKRRLLHYLFLILPCGNRTPAGHGGETITGTRRWLPKTHPFGLHSFQGDLSHPVRQFASRNLSIM